MTFATSIVKSETLPGVVSITHSKFSDHRGAIWTTFDENSFGCDLPLGLLFNHDKFAVNKKNVLRGIHGDTKSWKLVTAVSGIFYQVVVDCREQSPTYLKHEAFSLNTTDPISVLIPPGFGNAFLSLSDMSVYHYKLAYLGNYNDAHDQFTFKWNDPQIKIVWPSSDPILSERDK
ncbi:dTDP-4-dehydrorhamnose 3,5-epimerase family protein [Amylibacter sp.]|jgi:dTDP-4-dehydrorhamnose 3,5-epimerase|nr:dTDP-4-dehydrorhamnose 3,5-epimerase family protein [Amylibacter sp.]